MLLQNNGHIKMIYFNRPELFGFDYLTVEFSFFILDNSSLLNLLIREKNWSFFIELKLWRLMVAHLYSLLISFPGIPYCPDISCIFISCCSCCQKQNLEFHHKSSLFFFEIPGYSLSSLTCLFWLTFFQQGCFLKNGVADFTPNSYFTDVWQQQ